MEITHLYKFPLDLEYERWYQTTRITGLPKGENCTILWLLVLTHYQRETDRHAAYYLCHTLA